MQALLSIKPKYVEAIVSGEKRYEFRKSIFKSMNNIEKVYIYSSSPIRKIVGAFRIGKIIEDHPENLWIQLKQFSGLNALEFFSYFRDSQKGFAIQIEDLKEFEKPIDPRDSIPSFVPPQSFRYMNSGMLSALSSYLR